MRRGPDPDAWLLLAASQAVAAGDAQAGRGRSRIRTVVYDPDQVVALTGYFGYQMMIEFNPSERIENVSIGDGLAGRSRRTRRPMCCFSSRCSITPPPI